MKNTELNPIYRDPTQAEEMTWNAVVGRAKLSDPLSSDLDRLQQIERRAEQRVGAAPHFENDTMLAVADVAEFEAINDPHLQRFAAVQILDNALAYPDYKFSLVALEANKPGLGQKLTQLNAVNDQMIATKEDRKATKYTVLEAAEVKEMTQIAEGITVLARVWDAARMSQDAQEHFGLVLTVGSRFALQKTGRETFPLHRLSSLDQLPVKGQDLSIKYDKGVGVVVDQALKHARARTVGASR